MPIYEYHCQACGRTFEKLVFGQRPMAAKIACPGCASAEVSRDLSVFGMKSGSVGAQASSVAGRGGGACCGGGCGCR